MNGPERRRSIRSARWAEDFRGRDGPGGPGDPPARRALPVRGGLPHPAGHRGQPRPGAAPGAGHRAGPPRLDPRRRALRPAVGSRRRGGLLMRHFRAAGCPTPDWWGESADGAAAPRERPAPRPLRAPEGPRGAAARARAGPALRRRRPAGGGGGVPQPAGPGRAPGAGGLRADEGHAGRGLPHGGRRHRLGRRAAAAQAVRPGGGRRRRHRGPRPARGAGPAPGRAPGVPDRQDRPAPSASSRCPGGSSSTGGASDGPRPLPAPARLPAQRGGGAARPAARRLARDRLRARRPRGGVRVGGAVVPRGQRADPARRTPTPEPPTGSLGRRLRERRCRVRCRSRSAVRIAAGSTRKTAAS